MIRAWQTVTIGMVLLSVSCVSDPPKTTGNNQTTNNTSENNAETIFVELDDVTLQEDCSLQDFFVETGAASRDLREEVRLKATSVFDLNQPHAGVESGFSLVWANAEGPNIYVALQTSALDGTEATILEEYSHTFSVGTNVELTDITIERNISPPMGEPRYKVSLYTTAGVWTCQYGAIQSGLTHTCEPDETFNEAAQSIGLDPIAHVTLLPLLNEQNQLPLIPVGYVITGTNVDGDLGALIATRNGIIVDIGAVGFEIATSQETPFFPRLVLGVSEEANRAPYLLALTESGDSYQPRVMAFPTPDSFRYETLGEDWPWIPGLVPEEGRFAFASSLDITTGEGSSIDTVASDALFGYVAVLDDGSLGFSTSTGWGDELFRRWTPPEPIEQIWTFENLAYLTPPGDPLIVARRTDGSTMVIRWEIDNDELEVIPNALPADAGEIISLSYTMLVNHAGVIEALVDRGEDGVEIVAFNVSATRDFSDSLCR